MVCTVIESVVDAIHDRGEPEYRKSVLKELAAMIYAYLFGEVSQDSRL